MPDQGTSAPSVRGGRAVQLRAGTRTHVRDPRAHPRGHKEFDRLHRRLAAARAERAADSAAHRRGTCCRAGHLDARRDAAARGCCDRSTSSERTEQTRRGGARRPARLPEGEFKDLGSSFEAVSAQLAALGRASSIEVPIPARPPGAAPTSNRSWRTWRTRSAVFARRGSIFNNAAMARLAIPSLPATHPARSSRAHACGRKSQGPVSLGLATREPPRGRAPADVPARGHDRHGSSARCSSPATSGTEQVHSTLNYSRSSRRWAGDGRRGARGEEPPQRDDDSLELLKQKLMRCPKWSPSRRTVRRTRRGSLEACTYLERDQALDEVVNGFLKFARPTS